MRPLVPHLSCRNLDTNRDVRLLDAIAYIALTAGNPDDVFAAVFDKRQHNWLFLAKGSCSRARPAVI